LRVSRLEESIREEGAQSKRARGHTGGGAWE
jgi:hypothetical protein